MNALDVTSLELLALAARSLGGGDAIERTIQAAYNLGRADGRLEQVDETWKKLRAVDPALGAEACVTRDGVQGTWGGEGQLPNPLNAHARAVSGIDERAAEKLADGLRRSQ